MFKTKVFIKPLSISFEYLDKKKKKKSKSLHQDMGNCHKFQHSMMRQRVPNFVTFSLYLSINVFWHIIAAVVLSFIRLLLQYDL